jgi:hypothetical protein
VGPDHLSRLELGESGRDVDDQLRYANIFKVEAIIDYLYDIDLFFLAWVSSLKVILQLKRDTYWFVKQTINWLQVNSKIWDWIVSSNDVNSTMKGWIYYGSVTMELWEAT